MPFPLSALVTDPSQHFQLTFARKAEATLFGVGDIRAESSGAGLTIHATSEQALGDAWTIIAKGFPGSHRGEIKITYLETPDFREPYVQVSVDTPEDYYGYVVADLHRRGGLIESLDDSVDGKTVVVSGPLAGMLGLDAAVQEMTRGRGRLRVTFLGYRASARPEPPPPRPASRA